MTIVRPAEKGMTAALEKAAGAINEGGVIAYPTETFYGLGVRFDDRAALEKLYGMKHRSLEKALPLIVGNVRMLEFIAASIPGPAEKLINKFWPGPLTLLLPARPDIPEFVTAGTGKIAVRIPGESFALALARLLGFPLTATSANISGMPPADNADDVIRYFGNVLDLIVDCGRSPGGKPSTIVDASGEKIRVLREGAVPEEEILALF